MFFSPNTESYPTGWWFQPTPLKNDGVSNSWDDVPIYGKIKHVPNHQPAQVNIPITMATTRWWPYFLAYNPLTSLPVKAPCFCWFNSMTLKKNPTVDFVKSPFHHQSCCWLVIHAMTYKYLCSSSSLIFRPTSKALLVRHGSRHICYGPNPFLLILIKTSWMRCSCKQKSPGRDV